MFRWLVLFCALFLFACSDDPKRTRAGGGGNSGVLDGVPFMDLDGLEAPGTHVSGTRRLVFTEPLHSSRRNRINLEFRFLDQKTGKLRLSVNCDPDLRDGIDFEFSANDDGSLKAVNLRGKTVVGDFSEALAGRVGDPAGYKLGIEIHNDETPAHIVVFGLDGKKLMDLRAPNGYESLYGLELTSARVETAAATKAGKDH